MTDSWQNEVGEVLGPVGKPEAGVWERWAATLYLREEFAPRLSRESQALNGLTDRLPAEQGAHLWALGELLQLLCGHLCELGPMPQSGPAFAHAARKLVRAFEYWCAEADAAVEAVRECTPAAARVLEPLLGHTRTAVRA